VDLDRIITDLKRERNRLDRAIMALDEPEPTPAVAPMRVAAPVLTAPAGKGQGHMTSATRKRLSVSLKKYWAERRQARS